MQVQSGQVDRDDAGQGELAAFDLLANSFAMLGVTPQTPLADLLDAAGGDPVREALARALSVPRSRLAAEVAFLPGVAAGPVLDALRHGRRPALDRLPPLAAANVRAHLCAAGLAGEEDLQELAAASFAADAVATAIDADRAAAGMPAVQPAALAAELDALTGLHAGALVAGASRLPDPAGSLAACVRVTQAGGSPLVRRAVAAWGRQSALGLAELERVAGAACSAWSRDPSDATAGHLGDAVRVWAALSEPQRLADARSALDHPATVRAIQPWRQAARQMAAGGRPALALPVAKMLAGIFAGLPGQAEGLRQEARQCAALLEEQELAPLLDTLRQAVERLTQDPDGLRKALNKRPFDGKAPGDAGVLWRAFDAACNASVQSEAAWATMRPLVVAVGGEHRLDGAAAARAIQVGMALRANQTGHADLAARLDAEMRGLDRAVALGSYEDRIRNVWTPWWLLPLKRWRTLKAIRAALKLVDNPVQQQELLAFEARLRRRIRTGRIFIAIAVIVLAVIGAVVSSDEDYAKNAPYRRNAPVSLAAQPEPAAPLAFVPPAPAPAPIIPPVPAEAPAPHYAYAFHKGESEPASGTKTLARPEIRWCVANDIRLQAAQDAASSDQSRGLRPLGAEWQDRCNTPTVRRGDLDAVRAEMETRRLRLEAEGRAMLGDATHD